MDFEKSLIHYDWDIDGNRPLVMNHVKFESLLHNTIKKIINEENHKIAQLLIRSKINIEQRHIEQDDYILFAIQISMPQEYFEQLTKEDKKLIINRMGSLIENLNKSDMGELDYWCVEIKTELSLPEENWREELERELSLKRVITNQGGINNSDKVIYYNYLKYRSPAEVEITKELSKWDILYFPLPVSVIKGKKKEPDFLIQHPETKKFGILEINGDTYHTPTNSQQDHERYNEPSCQDRQF